MRPHVGILGLGLYLPPSIRRNDWWPADVVASWPASPDKFSGAVERRVMPDGMTSTDMEELAALDAIAVAGIAKDEIDLVLVQTLAPDYLAVNWACVLHQRLGLRRDCLTLQVDGAQNTFLLQLSVAAGMIESGRARRALLVQACPASKLLDYGSPESPIFGDGATAAVIGEVNAGCGLLGTARLTDGTHPRMLIASVPGARWFDAGRATLHIADEAAARAIMSSAVELAAGAISGALAAASLAPTDVTVSSVHQGTPWLQTRVREAAGVTHARFIETQTRTGHLFGALLPASLHAAVAAGILGDDDIVVMAGGGNGMTVGAAVMRWGRS